MEEAISLPIHLDGYTSQQDEEDSSASQQQKLLPVDDRASPGLVACRSLSPGRRTITYVLFSRVSTCHYNDIWDEMRLEARFFENQAVS